VRAYEERLDTGAKPKGGLVVLPCGYGKTVFALYLAAQHGRRTLVLVHKGFLVEQWQARMRQFLPGATVGVIQQGRIESDADVVVGMIQSIAKREYGDHVLSGFGLVIIVNRTDGQPSERAGHCHLLEPAVRKGRLHGQEPLRICRSAEQQVEAPWV